MADVIRYPHQAPTGRVAALLEQELQALARKAGLALSATGPASFRTSRMGAVVDFAVTADALEVTLDLHWMVPAPVKAVMRQKLDQDMPALLRRAEAEGAAGGEA